MTYGNSKRIVVVRDIPSNLIEEAIFILKSEPGGGGDGDGETDSTKKTESKARAKIGVSSDYLLKEAENIINGYINENKLLEHYGDMKKIKKVRNKININKSKMNLIINSSLVVSIALLIFVISRFF